MTLVGLVIIGKLLEGIMNLKKIIRIFILSFLFCFGVSAKTLEIMSYNVENLFDAKPDVVNGKSKEDFAYLPKDHPNKETGCKTVAKFRKRECYETNWTEEKIEWKLENVKTAIESEKNNKPDFLGLIEVENKEVVERLAKKLGYSQVEITESPDERGIDVALIFNETESIKKISRNEHVIDVERPTRNILEVEFLIDGKYPLTIFVNHWPSLSNPDSWRVKAAEKLVNRVKEIQTKNPAMSFLAIGDFNTIPENNPHPFTTVLQKDGFMIDGHENMVKSGKISQEEMAKMPKGSYFYAKGKQWNMLDRIFYSPNLTDGKDLEVTPESFRIHMPKSVLREWTIGKGDDPNSFVPFFVPKSFKHEKNSKDEMGFSDHLPIYMKIEVPETKVEVKKETKKDKKAAKKKK